MQAQSMSPSQIRSAGLAAPVILRITKWCLSGGGVKRYRLTKLLSYWDSGFVSALQSIQALTRWGGRYGRAIAQPFFD